MFHPVSCARICHALKMGEHSMPSDQIRASVLQSFPLLLASHVALYGNQEGENFHSRSLFLTVA